MENLLSRIFGPGSIMLNLGSITKDAVFDGLAGAIAADHPECDRDAMLAALWEREDKMSTGIAGGVAIPHAVCKGIGTMAGSIGISKEGIEYGALDGKPVHIVFMLAMGKSPEENHLRTLNMIFRLAKSEALAALMDAGNAEDVRAVLSRFQ